MKLLRDELAFLKSNHSLVGIKGGTEVEGMNFDEILFMKEVSRDIIPMTVKIGGPEARNDMRYMLSIGVDKILAPMIESPYALKNFVSTIKEIDKDEKALLAINIETITGFNNLDAIVRSPHFIPINQITVGRSDLSGSMEMDVEDKKVNEVTKKIVDIARYYNKKTSTGGKINPANAFTIKENIKSDYVNTRNMVVSCDSESISDDIKAAMLWERKFYMFLLDKYPERKTFYDERIKAVENRLGKSVMHVSYHN